jgi:hypothetical protein
MLAEQDEVVPAEFSADKAARVRRTMYKTAVYFIKHKIISMLISIHFMLISVGEMDALSSRAVFLSSGSQASIIFIKDKKFSLSFSSREGSVSASFRSGIN